MRLVLRLAVGSIRRYWGRFILVLALLSLPLGLALAAITLRTSSQMTPETMTSAVMGRSEGVVQHRELSGGIDTDRATDRAERQLTDVLGRPVDLVVEVNTPLAVGLGEREVDAFAYGLDADPLHEGRFMVLEGRWPKGTAEVVLSRQVAGILQADSGSEVGVGNGGTRAVVVGIAVIPTDTTRRFALTTPRLAADLMLVPAPGQDFATDAAAVVVWHLRESLPAPDLQRVDELEAWKVKSREAQRQNLAADRQGGPSAPDEMNLLVGSVFAFVVAEVALLIAAVYAVTTGSLRRELALLAVVGADRRHRVLVMGIQGLLAGLCSLLIGSLLGIVAALAAKPLLEERGTHLWGPLRWNIGPSVVLMAMVLVVPLLAAWACGRVAAHDVLPSIRAEQQQAKPGRWFRVGYVVAGAVGVSLAAMGAVARLVPFVFAGAVTLLIATALAVRDLLGGRRQLFGNLPIIGVLAGRFASVYPVRVTSIAVVIGSVLVFLGLVLASYGGMSARALATYVPVSPPGSLLLYATQALRQDTRAAVEATLGNRSQIVPLGHAVPPPPDREPGEAPLAYWGNITVQDPVDRCVAGGEDEVRCESSTEYFRTGTKLYVIGGPGLAMLLGRPLTGDEEDALAAGEVLVTDGRLLTAGQVRLLTDDDSLRSDRVAATAVEHRSATYSDMPNAFITQAGLRQIGGQVSENEITWFIPSSGSGITAEQEARIRSTVSADIGSPFYALSVERGSAVVAIMRKMTIGGIVFAALAASGLAFLVIGLAGREMRPVMTSLAAAGAARPVRVRIAAWHSVFVVGTGVAIACVVLLITAPLTAIGLHVPLTWWPVLGVGVAGGLSLATASLAGWLAGHRVGELARSDRTS